MFSVGEMSNDATYLIRINMSNIVSIDLAEAELGHAIVVVTDAWWHVSEAFLGGELGSRTDT